MQLIKISNWPAALSFILLAFQALMPWTVPHFVTQDGPSHLYSALVTRAGLFNASSPYNSIYQLNERMVPNWGGVLGFCIAALGGIDHAEKLLASIAVCLGFFSISYAIKMLTKCTSPWMPLTNFLIQTWFLWIGFYGFYLGMVILPLFVGYYVKCVDCLSASRFAIVSLGLMLLYFVHLIPALLGAIVILTIATWRHVCLPLFRVPTRHDLLISLRRWSLALAAALPTIVAIVTFVQPAESSPSFRLDPAMAWEFPRHVFTAASGRAGAQTFLLYAVLALIFMAIISLRPAEWWSATGGVAVATIVIFVCYFLVPDAGVGGSDAKIRIAWGVFLIGGLLIPSARRLRTIQPVFAIYCFVLLLSALVPTFMVLQRYSRVVDDYLAATSRIPRGVTFVRLFYPLPALSVENEYSGIGREPLFHLDASVAARCGCIDLSDYQAPNGIFQVDFKPSFELAHRHNLWALEGPGENAKEVIAWLRSTLPAKIDYVIVVADEASKPQGLERLRADLVPSMNLFAVFAKSFVCSRLSAPRDWSLSDCFTVRAAGSFDLSLIVRRPWI